MSGSVRVWGLPRVPGLCIYTVLYIESPASEINTWTSVGGQKVQRSEPKAIKRDKEASQGRFSGSTADIYILYDIVLFYYSFLAFCFYEFY